MPVKQENALFFPYSIYYYENKKTEIYLNDGCSFTNLSDKKINLKSDPLKTLYTPHLQVSDLNTKLKLQVFLVVFLNRMLFKIRRCIQSYFLEEEKRNDYLIYIYLG